MKIADKDYFLDAEGKVAASEEEAHTLLVREGQEMSKEVAEKIGSVKVARQSDTAAVEEADASEKAAEPAANKKASPSKNKGVKK